MTLSEVEIWLQKLTDNQVAQGEMFGRLECVVARNLEATTQNTEAIGHVAQAVTRLTETMAQMTEMMGQVTETMAQMNDRTSLIEAAMERLFEHIDRFIRGLEGNGHHRS